MEEYVNRWIKLFALRFGSHLVHLDTWQSIRSWYNMQDPFSIFFDLNGTEDCEETHLQLVSVSSKAENDIKAAFTVRKIVLVLELFVNHFISALISIHNRFHSIARYNESLLIVRIMPYSIDFFLLLLILVFVFLLKVKVRQRWYVCRAICIIRHGIM